MSEDASKRIEEIRARVEAATPGPWSSDPEGAPPRLGLGTTGYLTVVDVIVESTRDEAVPDHVARDAVVVDAAFIAHAREDVPWLLDELELATGAEGLAVARWKEMLVRAQAAECALATKWPALDADDRALPEDAAINEAFPTRSGSHKQYAEAMRLVGARRSKGGIVALVNWLLVREANAVRGEREAVAAYLRRVGEYGFEDIAQRIERGEHRR